MTDRQTRRYRDVYGNTATITSNRDGVTVHALIGSEAEVHHCSTVWGAFQLLRRISGGSYWVEV